MSCCVCDSCISTSKGKNRYRKLHGTSPASRSIKAILIACIVESFGATLDTFGMDKPSCVVCYECSLNLEKIAKFEKDIRNLKDKLLENFHSDQFPANNNDTQPCTPVRSQQRSQSTLASTRGAESSDNTQPCTPVRSQQETLNADNRSRSSSGPQPHPKRKKVVVSVDYACGHYNYQITPSREDATVQIARRHYVSMADSVVRNNSDETIGALAKQIKKEIDYVCSAECETIFKKDCNEVDFAWAKIWCEIEKFLPTLLSLLVGICNGKVNKPMLCMIVSIILKQRFHKLTYVQQTISIMLYGNSAHKQVYKCLQPLMLCLSHKGTLNLLDRVTKSFDSLPKSWKNCLVDRIQEDNTVTDTDRQRILRLLRSVSSGEQQSTSGEQECDDLDDLFQNVGLSELDDPFDLEDSADVNDDVREYSKCDSNSVDEYGSSSEDEFNDDTDSAEMDMSFSAPAYSPIIPHDDQGAFLDNIDQDVIGGEDVIVSDHNTAKSDSSSADKFDEVIHDTDSAKMDVSFSAPVYSPIIPHDDQGAFLDNIDQDVIGGENVNIRNHNTVVSRGSTDWKGFKIVGDNVDKNIRPSLQRFNNKTNSLHYFHYYAVLDRLDLSACSEIVPTDMITLQEMLVGVNDVSQLECDSIILISRILVQHLDQFKDQAKGVSWHIPSKFAKEMSTKSAVVPLGIILKNENVVNEMCEILEQFHTYVPSKPQTKVLDVPGLDQRIAIEDLNFHKILLGGDQLTAARCRGGAAVQSDHRTSLERLDGMVPVCEDWHAKRIYLMGIYKILFKNCSRMEKATFSQLKVLVNYSVNADPAKNMKAWEDLLLITLHAHVVAAARKILSEHQFSNVQDLAKELVVKYIYYDPNVRIDSNDKKYLYSLQVLTLTLLWHGFNDAVREGDGDRVLIYWKFFAVVFKVTRHTNYFKEAILLQLQYHYLFTKRQAEQLKWCRFINTKGRRGCNISCDLHIEHLNRRLKSMMMGMHCDANAIKRAAKAIGVINSICETLEKEVSHVDSGKHRASFMKECSMMVNELIEQDVFKETAGRSHPSFKNIKPILQQCPHEVMLPYIIQRLKTYQI